MEKMTPPEAAPLCSCHPEGLGVVVQPEMFKRDAPAPLLVTLTVSIVDETWHVGGSIVTLDTLEQRALVAHHDLDGTPALPALYGCLVTLLGAADDLRSPFPP